MFRMKLQFGICLILFFCMIGICSCTVSNAGKHHLPGDTDAMTTMSAETENTETVSSDEVVHVAPIRYRRTYEKTALHESYPALTLNGPMYFRDETLHVLDTKQGMLHLFDRQGVLLTSLSVPKDESRNLLFAYPMTEERYVLVERRRDEKGYQFYAVRVVTANGEELSAAEIKESSSECVFAVYEEYSTVHLMLGLSSELYYFSCSASSIQVFSIPEPVYPLAQYVYSGSGKFTRLFSNSHKMTYDFYKEQSTETPLRMPEKYQYDTLYRGADKNYYVRSKGNLYLLKEDDHMECVLNGMDSTMPNKALGQQNLAILDEYTFFSQEMDELYLYRVSLVEETEERQEIELVVMDLGASREWLEASVSQFNNQNTDYYVSLEYRNYIDETGTNLDVMMDASLQDLLLYHKHPDILILDNTGLLAKYQDKGIFADLYQLLDTPILGCIKEAFGAEEALYQMPMMMQVDTFAASTDVTSGFLTYETFYDIIDTLAPGEVLCGKDFNQTFFKNALMDFVDFNAKTTSYQSEMFHNVVLYRDQLSKLTDFHAGALSNGYIMGSDGTYGDTDTYWTSNGTLPTALKNGSVKFLAMDFNTVEAYGAAKLLYGDTAFTLCGYPSLDGCGASIQAFLPTAVFADSDVIPGCEAFMEFLLSDTRQSDTDLTTSYLPVTRSAMEKAIDNNREYRYLQATVNQLREGTTPGYMNLNAYRGADTEGYVTVPIEDDDKAAILSFFENCHMRANADPFILSIVNEELSFYEGHARSLEETTKIIDSRVWIYLNE